MHRPWTVDNPYWSLGQWWKSLWHWMWKSCPIDNSWAERPISHTYMIRLTFMVSFVATNLVSRPCFVGYLSLVHTVSFCIKIEVNAHKWIISFWNFINVIFWLYYSLMVPIFRFDRGDRKLWPWIYSITKLV